MCDINKISTLNNINHQNNIFNSFITDDLNFLISINFICHELLVGFNIEKITMGRRASRL